MERYFSLGDYSALSQTSTSLTATETTKKWLQFIDSATRELIERMKSAEQSINGGMSDHEDIKLTLQNAFDDFTKKAANFENEVDNKSIIKQARIAFHQKTNDLFSKSYCFNRTRTWPQGYQGDYKTLETLYRSVPQSDGLGYFLDNFTLNTTLAIAVRNRIRMIQDILKTELSRRLRPEILNIACGSCRELFEITPEITDSKAHFTCIDHDNDALSFSQNRLYYTDALRYIDFKKYNALRLFDHEVAVQDFGHQDIIYSAGLFDYLESDFLIKVLTSMYRILNDGGKLIAAFKDMKKYRSQKYHWFFDWDGFLQRSDDDFRNILAEAQIPASKIAEQRDETGAIIFYTISK